MFKTLLTLLALCAWTPVVLAQDAGPEPIPTSDPSAFPPPSTEVVPDGGVFAAPAVDTADGGQPVPPEKPFPDGDGGAGATPGSVNGGTPDGGNTLEQSWTPALFGDPTPMTRRPPTNRFLTFESSFKFGLVGTGPTRFVTDFRFSLLDWLEVRTQMGPILLPEDLMFRLSVGRYRQFGRVGVEGGLHKFDLGVRIFPDAGEQRGFNPDVVPSVSLAGALTYDVPIWDRFSLHASLRVQQRVQQSFQGVTRLDLTNPLDQFSGQLALQGGWDVTKTLGMTLGVAYGQAIANAVVDGIVENAVGGTAPWNEQALPIVNVERARRTKDPLTVLDTRGQCGEAKTRTLWIDFAESGRPGFSTLVDREQNCSLSFMGALTYGRTEAFDVDLFGNVRVWPTIGGLFGAGIRWRIAP